MAQESNPRSLTELVVEHSRTRSIARKRELEETILRLAWPLIRRLALKHQHRVGSLEDAEQLGRIAVFKAIEMYAVDANTKFETYVSHKIIGAFKHEERDRASIIRIPAWMGELITKYCKTYIALQWRLEREPTENELAEALNTNVASIKKMARSWRLKQVHSIENLTDGYGDDANETRSRGYEHTFRSLWPNMEGSGTLDVDTLFEIALLRELKQQHSEGTLGIGAVCAILGLPPTSGPKIARIFEDTGWL